MKEEKITFKLFDDEGKEVEYEVLFTFESNETNKNYIVYTDNQTDEDGNIKVYASIYEPKEDGTIDDNTVLKHLNALSDEDKILYMLLSRKILKVAKAKNKDFDYTKIEKIINNNFE